MQQLVDVTRFRDALAKEIALIETVIVALVVMVRTSAVERCCAQLVPFVKRL